MKRQSLRGVLSTVLLGAVVLLVTGCEGGWIGANQMDVVGWTVFAEGNREPVTGEPEPAPNVIIRLVDYFDGTEVGTAVSASDGYFILEAVQEGTYTLTFELEGYETLTLNHWVISFHDTTKSGTVELTGGEPIFMREPDMTVTVGGLIPQTVVLGPGEERGDARG